MAHEEGFSLRLAHIMPDRPGLKIYVPRDQAEGLREAFEDAGYETQELQEFAFGVDDAIIGVFLYAGTKTVQALAPALVEYIKRNQHKQVSVKSGDVAVDVKGMSDEEAQKAVKKLLEEVDKTQRSEDDSWHRILDETDDGSGGDDDAR